MEDYTYTDEKAFRRLSWTWAKACDLKQWDILLAVCAPSVNLQYSSLSPHMQDEVREKTDYIENFVKHHLGDERLKTQHLLGAVVFSRQDADHATGSWQCQAQHIRTLSSGETAQYTGACYVDHFYERIDGVWHFAGIKPHSLTGATIGKFEDVIGKFD